MNSFLGLYCAFVLYVAGLACLSQPANAQDVQCKLGPYIRPVIVTSGFRGSPLFNSSNKFSVEWVNPLDFAPGANTDKAKDDLKLPLTWNAANLTQDYTDVGPEAFPGDATPGLTMQNGSIVPFLVPTLSNLISLVRGWEDTTEAKGMQLLYTVAYDWRRDLFEQAERLANVVEQVVDDTGCKPVVVAHSFGGLVTYGAIARFGKELADKIQGVLYAGSPVQPASPALIPFILGQPGSGAFGDPDLLFTFASLFGIVPQPDVTCTNGPPLLPPADASAPADGPADSPAAGPAAAGAVTECAPGELRTGITCKSEACGRPTDWPEDKPFFLGLDLHDPVTWQAFGLGLPLARALSGQTDNLLYTPEELAHIGFATAAGARMMDHLVGVDTAAVAAVHPPAVQLTAALGNVSVPGRAEPMQYTGPTSLECVPAPTFGQLGQVQCTDFLPDELVPSDGLLPSTATVFHNTSLFGDNLQVAKTTVPPDFWLRIATLTAPDVPFSPHVVLLQARETPPDTFVDCANYSATLETTPDVYPSLESMICALVLQGDAAAPGAAPATAPAPARAAPPPGDAVDEVGNTVAGEPDAATPGARFGVLPVAAAAVAAAAWGALQT